MAEIFKEAQAFNEHPGRSNHDLSHKSYGTFKMGYIYPVMTLPMAPTDSFRVDVGALLQFMPTATPLQSNVRVIFNAFFQRNKNVHKDWQNQLEQLEDANFPYVLPSIKEFVPGSIHDYLDVPVVSVEHGDVKVPIRFVAGPVGSTVYYMNDTHSIPSISGSNRYPTFSVNASQLSSHVVICFLSKGLTVIPVGTQEEVASMFQTKVFCKFYDANDFYHMTSVKAYLMVSAGNEYGPIIGSSSDYELLSLTTNFEADPETSFFFDINPDSVAAAVQRLGIDGPVSYSLVFEPSEVGKFVFDESCFDHETVLVDVKYSQGVMNTFVKDSFPLCDVPDACPFATKEFPDRPIRLKSFRYRTYESVYNAFFRNSNGNQPFIVDGQVQYNKYNTTTDSGLDSTVYELKKRNWELDAYTSCLPSPQQGNPPLVGVSSTGRVTVQDDDGTVSTMQLQDLEDGQQGVRVTQMNAASDNHRQILMSLASSGFTINDLRETNALQKFLETNIRKGFRYVDFILGHFGRGPKHVEMDMPEYVGGATVKLDVGKVTNTNAAAGSANPNDVLGQFAGSAQAFGSSKHSVNYYADDYGYLMITMCIVPDSAYSQVLPKDFLYSSPLDWPFPEFSRLGYQPITYEEFCPIEAYKDTFYNPNHKITDVFGYQRPQHELVWVPDRLHGQFLTTMNNYVISRFFSGRPELGDDFLTIKPEETQNVFAVTKADNDIAFGQLAFKLTAKRFAPRIVIPSIGR